MKMMIAIALLAVMAATSLASYAKEFTCDGCNEEVKSKQHKEEVFGEEVILCDDCYDELEEIKKEISDLEDALSE